MLNLVGFKESCTSGLTCSYSLVNNFERKFENIFMKPCYVAVCNNYAICNKLQTALNCNAVCNTLQTAFRVLKNPDKTLLK